MSQGKEMLGHFRSLDNALVLSGSDTIMERSCYCLNPSQSQSGHIRC